MKIINASAEIVSPIDGEAVLRHIEKAGKVCYRSEGNITENSYRNFIRNIIKSGHESVLEHYSFTVYFICDRAIANEIVRHRIASYSQESTRYCSYDKDRFGNEITVIRPYYWTENSSEYQVWKQLCAEAEKAYLLLLSQNASPEKARAVLPLSLKTELYMTANIREWRHFFKLRCANAAHPQMRELSLELLDKARAQFPILFDDN